MGTAKFNLLDKLIAFGRLRQIKKYFNKEDIVLDFGCGKQCFLLRNINLGIKKGIGLDYDADNQTIGDNVQIRKFYFKDKLPFPENSFTKVAMLAVLEHLDLDKVNPLFKELKRVLRPTGLIILTTPTPKSKPIMEFLAVKLHLISKLEIMDHKKYYSEKDLSLLAKNFGFSLQTYKLFQLNLNSLCIFEKKS